MQLNLLPYTWSLLSAIDLCFLLYQETAIDPILKIPPDVLFRSDLAKEFEMKNLGLLHYFLGLEIWQRSDGLFVSQGKYAWEILKKFNMHGCKPVDTPLPGGWRKEDAALA